MNNRTLLQIRIYTRKFFRTQKKESIISIFIGIIITLLVMAVTQNNMYKTFGGTQSGLFALVCVCIWIGIFNSIQLVCREKNNIVKDELDKSLKPYTYMMAHFIYQFALCLVQSVIVFGIFYLFMTANDKPLNSGPISYFITIFLIMYASDAMAFVISAAVPTPIAAMTVMPLLLLVQLVLAGVLFELEGAASSVALFTISRWGMVALGKLGQIAEITTGMKTLQPDPEIPGQLNEVNIPISETYQDMYEGESSEAIICWICFIGFIVVFYVMSVLALKFTTRKMKK